MTLLVLAIYKHDLLKPSYGDFLGVVCALYVIHIFYILWTIRLSVANRNDAKRRNFYLQKTEYISDCLLKKFGDPLHRKMESEYDLIDTKENKIEKAPGPIEAFKHMAHLWSNYAPNFQFVLPTILFSLLVYVYCKELCIGWRGLVLILMPLLLLFVISIIVYWVKKRKNKKRSLPRPKQHFSLN